MDLETRICKIEKDIKLLHKTLSTGGMIGIDSIINDEPIPQTWLKKRVKSICDRLIPIIVTASAIYLLVSKYAIMIKGVLK